jgi:hypothetical protein
MRHSAGSAIGLCAHAGCLHASYTSVYLLGNGTRPPASGGEGEVSEMSDERDTCEYVRHARDARLTLEFEFGHVDKY